MLGTRFGSPCFAGGPMIDAAELPACGGAYALFIDLPKAIGFDLRGAPVVFAPGSYLYCGSARGPGGIRARVTRHLKRHKTVRWHVDQLTTGAGRIVGILAVPDGSECELLERFARLEGAAIPVAGFGSSDCRHCRAHLLRLDLELTALPGIARSKGELLLLDGDRASAGRL